MTVDTRKSNGRYLVYKKKLFSKNSRQDTNENKFALYFNQDYYLIKTRWLNTFLKNRIE